MLLYPRSHIFIGLLMIQILFNFVMFLAYIFKLTPCVYWMSHLPAELRNNSLFCSALISLKIMEEWRHVTWDNMTYFRLFILSFLETVFLKWFRNSDILRNVGKFCSCLPTHGNIVQTVVNLEFFSSMKRFSIFCVKYRKSDGTCTQTYCMGTQTHIRGSRCGSRSGNKLVRKAGDKRARAHCPRIRDEQRCENVTTNSLWSPNVTSPLYSTPLPSSYSAPVSFFSNLPSFTFFFHLRTPFRRVLLFSSLSPSAPLSSFDTAFLFIFSKGQTGEGNRVKELEFS